jgi:hypothetical protein
MAKANADLSTASAANPPADEPAAAGPATTTRKKRKKGKRRKYNKTAFMREALDELGKDASNQDLHKFIKDKHGVDIPGNQVSNIKSNVLKEMRGKRKGRASNGAAKPKTTSSAKSSMTVDEVRTLKDLLDRFGVKAVQEALDLFKK